MKQNEKNWENNLTRKERKEFSLLIIITYGVVLFISVAFANLLYCLLKLLK
jgi:hypothetical protein